MTARARYDGNADWYEERVAWSSAAATPLIARLVGAGPGRCVDVGCGTGVHLAALAAAGWSVVGADLSGDQLAVARPRAGSSATALVRGDVAGLPFVDGAFDLVLSAFTHSDVDDFGALAREGRRVLRPAGRFVYVGLHPCFTGPFAEQPRADGARVVHPGYARAGWRTGGPGTVVGGLTGRVGFHQRPLADVLNSLLDADLRLLHVEEGGNAQLPEWLALVAMR
ncbi:MAG TPA: methyltransferase domain-containing protein [Actinomycetes bacterium]|jgi:SAM-dependent methyltransferase|nr:methyltransferase domain-containing protein [Actinomycetes bacterium]